MDPRVGGLHPLGVVCRQAFVADAADEPVVDPFAGFRQCGGGGTRLISSVESTSQLFRLPKPLARMFRPWGADPPPRLINIRRDAEPRLAHTENGRLDR